jgi:hypothetical protein
MLRVVEVAAWALFLVCVVLLFTIQAVRFCCSYAIAVLVLICCAGGVVLWGSGA